MTRRACHVERFTTGSRYSLKDFRKSQMRKRICGNNRQVKNFYAMSFDALVKRLDKCMNVDGDMSRNTFFSRFEYRMFLRFISILTYLMTLPRTYIELRRDEFMY
jgi:hypothetical protein